ncbi:hypothetical protein [Actinoplanes couchii]|uniref:Uncharacterized protein n=1 Tax=Actinoplanes couchii TaxID=403638 RepID=A0ABQ3XRW1_9ACTN|nr:hypothetical protein [Actinoplanes couchii]MDR6318728.1 hypothetical protein [Actinoplanes couchii]GID61256.1 hypothetical protein Aco03nite_096600 [Actinoplanes couchii]
MASDRKAIPVTGESLPDDRRPFRTHVDPSRDGSEVVSAVADRIRAEFYHRLGIEGLLPLNASL